MGNYKNSQYYGTLYVGSEKAPHEFIFDTGSPWLWVATTDCKDCHTTELFDTDSSNSFDRLSDEKKKILYETGSVQGYIA